MEMDRCILSNGRRFVSGGPGSGPGEGLPCGFGPGRRISASQERSCGYFVGTLWVL